MSQSSTIAFFLIVGFIVFITMKGQLPSYAAILLGNAPTNQATPQTTNLNGLPSLPSLPSLGTLLPGLGDAYQNTNIGGISF